MKATVRAVSNRLHSAKAPGRSPCIKGRTRATGHSEIWPMTGLTGIQAAPQCLLLYFPPVPVATSTSPKRLLIARLVAWLPAAILVLAVAGPMKGNAGKRNGQGREGSRST